MKNSVIAQSALFFAAGLAICTISIWLLLQPERYLKRFSARRIFRNKRWFQTPPDLERFQTRMTAVMFLLFGIVFSLIAFGNAIGYSRVSTYVYGFYLVLALYFATLFLMGLGLTWCRLVPGFRGIWRSLVSGVSSRNWVSNERTVFICFVLFLTFVSLALALTHAADWLRP